MVTLIRNADLPFSLHAARVQPINLQRLIPLFRELGFNRYQDEARKLATASPAARITEMDDDLRPDAPVQDDTPSDETAQAEAVSPFALDSFALPAVDRDYETAASGNYEAVTTRAQLDALVA